MNRHIYRVTGFQPVERYRLTVEFDDGSRQEIDFEPVLRGELFAPLRDPVVFRRVRLDEEFGTLVWPNGTDFDPATLHDWPLCGPRLAALAARWDESAEKVPAGLAVAEHPATYSTKDADPR